MTTGSSSTSRPLGGRSSWPRTPWRPGRSSSPRQLPDSQVKCSAEVVAMEALGAVEWEKVALCSGRPRCPMPTRRSELPDSSSGAARSVLPAPESRAGRVPGHPLDGLDRSVSGCAGRELAGRPGSARPDPERRADAGAELRSGDKCECRGKRPSPSKKAHKSRDARTKKRKSHCGLSGELTPLATLRGGATLLGRITTSAGGAYFCATTPAVGDSSLATNGVVLYVLVQRALRRVPRSWAIRAS